jgi:hypothetical protein
VKKVLVSLCLVLCACGAGFAHATQQPDAWILEDISMYRGKTWHFQGLMGVGPTRSRNTAANDPSRTYKLWVRSLWLSRAKQAKARFQSGPPHQRQWTCIHRYEGSWTDRGGPYYGGLQMDIAFMRLYGGKLLRTKGTADRWTPLEQMWVAEKAFKSGRGFYPWPNTARYCGLI